MRKLDNFIAAFSPSVSSIYEECACGITYYDTSSENDFEDGKFETLSNDEKAIGINCSVRTICFEGKDYVLECECWKARAKAIAAFIDGHGYQIAEYLNLERKRKIDEANMSPFVEDIEVQK